MKKLFYPALIIPFLVFSCKPSPEAYFHTDISQPEVGQAVAFINESKDADHFEWDFGDGYVSTDENPVHVFTGTGTYEVSLKAFSKRDLADEAFMTLKVMIPTLLEVEVLEYYDEYPVANASILLYSSITDWDAAIESKALAEATTDADGFAVFSHLDHFVHYVDVWEKNHNNYLLRDEDINFIRTPEIIPHKINRFLAYVDYVESSKGVREKGSYIIRKIERKAVDKISAMGSDTDNWQELYAKSIKLK